MASSGPSVLQAARITLRRMAPLLREQRKWYWSGLVFVFLSIGLTLAYPQVMRIIIDEGIQGGKMSVVNELALLMIAILLVEGPATYLRTYLFDVGARRTGARLQKQFFEHTLSQEIGFYDAESTGELNARLTNDTRELTVLISQWVPEGIQFGLYGLFGLVFMVATSPLLTLAVLMVGPLVSVGTSILGRQIQKRMVSVQGTIAAAASTAYEAFTGIRTVRAYGQEQAEVERYSEKLDAQLKAGNLHTRSAATLEGVITLSSESAVVVALWAGGTLILTGALTAGGLVSFIIYTGLVVRSFKNLSRFFAEVMRSHGATERIFTLMAREPRLPTSGGAVPESLVGDLEFQHVRFSYPTRPDVETLHGIDLEVRAGEFLAIVGASGSGKSTLGGLVARLYDPTEGRILLDGRDLRDLDPGWLRKYVTFVSQDSSLFSRSLGENVRFGSQNAKPDEVEEALAISHADEFLDELPEGLDTEVGDRGVRFSGGQRQRIALARAILRRPRILILDEATAALDSEREELVKQELRKLPDQPTVIIVAHRLSTVVDMDRVVVVKDGCIVGSGTHEELLATSGVYRDLVEDQLVSD